MGTISRLLSDIEGGLIREEVMISEFEHSIDKEVDSYSVVDIKDIGTFYGENPDLFQDNYWESVFKNESDIPVLRDGTAATGFVREDENSIEQVVNGEYSAAYRPGKIEVYDEELWQQEIFQESVKSWEEWRKRKSLVNIPVRKLYVEKFF